MKVYQIEVSNVCDLTCSYCPHPTQKRPKGLMQMEVFKKSIELVKKCGQSNVYLHNFGEPLLHPNLPEYIAYAQKQGVTVSFYTNGKSLSQDLVMKLASAGLKTLCVSRHIKGQLSKVKKLLEQCGGQISVSEDFRPSRIRNHSWAGQVQRIKKIDSNKKAKLCQEPCIFERENAFVIHWDGKIGTCCISIERANETITVNELLNDSIFYEFEPINICQSCELMRGHEEL